MKVLGRGEELVAYSQRAVAGDTAALSKSTDEEWHEQRKGKARVL
jgi:hypothetical protein